MAIATPSCSASQYLAHIRAVALDLQRDTATRLGGRIDNVGASGRHSPTQQCPLYDMPMVGNISQTLINAGASMELAQSISNSYHRHGYELRNRIQEFLHGIWSDPTFLPFASDTTREELFRRLVKDQFDSFERRLSSWTATVIALVKNRSTTQPHGPQSRLQEKRTRFNTVYLPLLEHFFNENAFPTHADKAFLAKKTGMTYHQIHVWFQNHRSRAKKEGRALRKKPMREAPKSSFDELIKQMGDHIIPKEQREEYVDSDASEYEWQYDSSDIEGSNRFVPKRQTDVTDVLDIPAPPHAFPALYPPPYELNPFPVKDGIPNFPAPVWRRLPGQTSVKYTPVDLDEVIEAFKNLVVRDGSRKRWVKKQRPDPRNRSKSKRTSPPPPKPDQSAATAAITTKLPSAPLHAFIPPVLVTPPSPFHPSQIPSVPAPPSRRHVFKSPSPQSKPATLVPPTSPTPDLRKSPARSRKVAPLPKRMPRGTSIAHRGVTPAASEASISSPSPSSSHSRTPSFEFESSPSRLFSDSSSMSSEVVTPESSTTALPGSMPAPSLSLPGFDFSSPSNMSELFGDCPSPVEGLQHSLQSQHGPGGKKTPALDFTFGRPVPFSFGQTQS